ncbi:methyltransferase domain-containing protein, partial [Microbacterium arthrosphaerae]|uniref:methyltransferase domain-containing protein n=1 Tax=Microbacterium arthrosphaerae TaxID=792652 RepID=UPI0035E48FBD
RAIEVAVAAGAAGAGGAGTARAEPGVTFRCADAATLVAEGRTFDAVLSNHVLHHLGAGLPDFAAESLALSHGLVLHSDIARSRLAYSMYAVAITPFAAGTFLRTDGLRSIRRSYTVPELAAVLDEAMPGRWTVRRPVPFRVLATGRGRG